MKHNPNNHNLEVVHFGVCRDCGGTSLMNAPAPDAPYTLAQRFTDNGAHSHWELINSADGAIAWMSENDIMPRLRVFQSKISHRMDELARHFEEYKGDGSLDAAANCDIKRRTLKVVSDELDEILKKYALPS